MARLEAGVEAEAGVCDAPETQPSQHTSRVGAALAARRQPLLYTLRASGWCCQSDPGGSTFSSSFEGVT